MRTALGNAMSSAQARSRCHGCPAKPGEQTTTTAASALVSAVDHKERHAAGTKCNVGRLLSNTLSTSARYEGGAPPTVGT